MENVREEAQMNQEELKQVAGGNIIDDIGCAIKGHNFILEEGYITGHFQYSYFKCKRCGEKIYTKRDQWTGEETTISKKEFKSVSGE